MSLVTHSGACHCGAVQFQFDAPPDLVAWDCNCECGAGGSAGRKLGWRRVTRPPAQPAHLQRHHPTRGHSHGNAHPAGSICTMKRNTHAIVPEAQFRITAGESNLSLYQVGASGRRRGCAVGWLGVG